MTTYVKCNRMQVSHLPIPAGVTGRAEIKNSLYSSELHFTPVVFHNVLFYESKIDLLFSTSSVYVIPLQRTIGLVLGNSYMLNCSNMQASGQALMYYWGTTYKLTNFSVDSIKAFVEE